MDNDKKTKEYLEKWQNVKLSDSARVRIEKDLIEYVRFHGVKTSAQRAEPGVFAGIREHLRARSKNSRAAGATGPVRVEGDSRSITQVSSQNVRHTSLFSLFKQPKSMTAAIIAIALIVGGGTSYAAEGTVPGDALYVVKTEVNENVRSAFAVSNEAEARLQARLAEERLEEAEELAARGELTAQVATDIDTRLKAHYEKAQERSNTAEAEGDYESSAMVRASLEGTFRTHADILADLNTRVSGNNGTSLINNIRTYASAAAESQTRATATIETSVSAKAAAEATIVQADTMIAKVEAKLARAESALSAEAHARAEAKLAEAVNAQAEARASFRAEAYQAAYSSVQAAIRIANEVETMIDSMLRLKIDVGVGTDTVIDGVLDVRTGNDTSYRNNTSSDTDAQTTTDTNAEIDVELDSDVDSDILDATVDNDTSVKTNTGLSL